MTNRKKLIQNNARIKVEHKLAIEELARQKNISFSQAFRSYLDQILSAGQRPLDSNMLKMEWLKGIDEKIETLNEAKSFLSGLGK